MIMKVRVLFFGAIADAVGSRTVTLPITDGATPATVVQQLNTEHPRLASRRLLFAVNEEHTDDATRLRDGDELAIFTPVSGG